MTINNIENLESGASVRGKLNDVISEVNSLGTAANADVGDFATSAQGALADTAVQPGDLGVVATTNDYTDLDNLPSLGTISSQDSDNVTITGGTINGTAIGASTASTGAFTTLSASTSLTTPLITRAGNLALSATGANIITASTNGVERMRIDSAGNVGIGTSSPNVNLHLAANLPSFEIQATGADAGRQITRITNDAGNFRLSTRTSAGAFVSNDYLIDRDNSGATLHAWRTGNTERMIITSAGNVGIGTTSPGQRLDVNGTANATNFTRGGSQVYSRNNILGTVSQSGGVPTGAIIERGSNANGEFVKYADGTQICHGTITVDLASPASSTAAGLTAASFVSTPYPILFGPTQSSTSYSGTNNANREALAGLMGRVTSGNDIRITKNAVAGADSAGPVVYTVLGFWRS